MKLMQHADVKQIIVEYTTDDERQKISDALEELQHNFTLVYSYVPSFDDGYYRELECFDTLNDAIKAAQKEVENNACLGAPIADYYEFYKMPFHVWKEVTDYEEIPYHGEKVTALRPSLKLEKFEQPLKA